MIGQPDVHRLLGVPAARRTPLAEALDGRPRHPCVLKVAWASG